MPLNKYIDHTILKPTCLVADIEKLCAEAKQYDFAAVCVPPNFVKLAKEKLAGSTVQVATVIGFPFGYSATEAKIAEIILAMVDGADELDVVANIAAIKNGDWTAIADEINHIMPIIRSKNKLVKIIIESGVLTDDEIIKCCDIYGIAGIDYLKTSTGYAEKGASVEAVKLFRKHLPDQVQIKASGGIRDYAAAKLMIEAGATRIGCSAGVAIVSGANTDNVKSNY
ncbi:MAG: deoxyribose-phosphate aldolase [Chitinophagaceae bacterium]|nr:deoxyribose-phosphate aldolase [Chitinophagaceae bacterium]